MESMNGVVPMKTLLASLAVLLASNVLLAQDSPLTGAQVQFDDKQPLETIDLLKKVDARKDALAGDWGFSGGRLVGGSKGYARLPIGPAGLALPEEYNIVFQVTRTGGDDSVTLSFPAPGGGRGLLCLDWNHQAITGLGCVDKGGPEVSGAGIRGAVLKRAQPRTVALLVRKSGVVIQLEGKDYFGYRVDWKRVSIHLGELDRPDQSGFSLTTCASQVAVSQLKIIYQSSAAMAPETKR